LKIYSFSDFAVLRAAPVLAMRTAEDETTMLKKSIFIHPKTSVHRRWIVKES
jgi:hypothetical protein